MDLCNPINKLRLQTPTLAPELGGLKGHSGCGSGSTSQHTRTESNHLSEEPAHLLTQLSIINNKLFCNTWWRTMQFVLSHFSICSMSYSKWQSIGFVCIQCIFWGAVLMNFWNHFHRASATDLRKPWWDSWLQHCCTQPQMTSRWVIGPSFYNLLISLLCSPITGPFRGTASSHWFHSHNTLPSCSWPLPDSINFACMVSSADAFHNAPMGVSFPHNTHAQLRHHQRFSTWQLPMWLFPNYTQKDVINWE